MQHQKDQAHQPQQVCKTLEVGAQVEKSKTKGTHQTFKPIGKTQRQGNPERQAGAEAQQALARDDSRPKAGTKKGNAFWDKKNGRQHLMLNTHLEGGLAKKKIESSQHTRLQ
ncbi:MAG: hypothetical protein LW834_03105 [Cyanobium sp. 49614_E6]|nr:hypothetical protein [Cyanobium sp. 49614_E6]